NRAEIPMDICAIAKSAGASYITRCSGLDRDLDEKIAKAIEHKGFSIVETLGMCTGRYTKRNKLTPKVIDQIIEDREQYSGAIEKNQRPEYGKLYKDLAGEKTRFPEPVTLEKQFDFKNYQRQEVVILGSAGMRIVTAGDIVCYAGMNAGMNVSIKNDYNITVLRGQSVSEILIDPQKIGYTGIESPTIVLALSDEGVQRRQYIFADLKPDTFVLKEKSVAIPETKAEVVEIDFKKLKIKKQDWALASLGIIARQGKAFNKELLESAVKLRFNEKVYQIAMETINKTIV
ncbi:MAG: 2-oxoacid:acceptor oxidoreductase family protein, partial [Desulfobacula sp.]|nr:2-oxoacid:acceptor oxidoreductase family protein [Desulfobacula sp.]